MSNRPYRVLLVLAAFVAVLITARDGRAQTPTPGQGGDCCVAHNGIGCDDQDCEDCVVDLDPICAIEPWDQFCVADTTDCAVQCECDRTPSPTPTPGGACCSPHAGTGCDVASHSRAAFIHQAPTRNAQQPNRLVERSDNC